MASTCLFRFGFGRDRRMPKVEQSPFLSRIPDRYAGYRLRIALVRTDLGHFKWKGLAALPFLRR